MQRQQLRDATHKVVLLCTAAAGLAPVLQNLFQLSHPQLLQVNRGQVQLLLCRREDKVESAAAYIRKLLTAAHQQPRESFPRSLRTRQVTNSRGDSTGDP